jgi:MSHA pilin protein MshC
MKGFMTINRPSDTHGFTLFEVILVLVLITIFATVAVSRQPATDASLKAQADVLRSHIRYAQMRALNTDTAWGIGIGIDSGASTYYLLRETQKRILPGETVDTIDLDAKNITISCSAKAVMFDAWGRPAADGVMLSDASLPIVLGKDGLTESLTIMPNTGFVP